MILNNTCMNITVYFIIDANYHFHFNTRFPTNDKLKMFIERTPKLGGPSNLDEALKTAKDQFNPIAGARPGANSVLVVITDKNADSAEDKVQLVTILNIYYGSLRVNARQNRGCYFMYGTYLCITIQATIT